MQRILLLLALCGMLAMTACSGASARPAGVDSHYQSISASLFQGSDTADWPMFGYDTGHTGYVDPLVHPGTIGGKILWSRHFAPVFSSSVAGLGMLYIASSDGFLYALDQQTGATVWRTNIGDYLTDSTPALEGQVLFVATHSNRMEALNALTGRMYWSFDTQEKIQAPPMIAANRVLLASRTTVWALDSSDGHVLWKFHRGAVAWPSTGSPTLAGNTLYIGLGSATQFWALNVQNGQVQWAFDTKDRITSTALVGNDSVYVATWHGTIFALSRATGQELWSYSLNPDRSQNVIDGVGGSMAFAEGKLYIGDYRGGILCLDAVKGTLVWRFATGAQVVATPIVASGLVYVGSSDGYFYALNTQTGRPAWRYATGEVRDSATLASNHLFVGSVDGNVYAFS